MLADVIKKLLTEQGKSQRELAKYVDVRPNTVSDWLTKRKSPSAAYMYRICDFFQVSFDYLFTGKDIPQAKNELSEAEQELLKIVHPLTPNQQQRVIGVVQNYLGIPPKPFIELPKNLPSVSDGIRELQAEQLAEAFKNSTKPVK